MGHILVIDDDPVSRSIIQRAMRLAGHTTEEAMNVDEALEKIDANPNGYDLFTVDILMPILGGVDFLNEIKKRHLSLPVIIVSAHLWDHDIVLPAYPHLDRLPKPFSIQELIDKVNVLLTAQVA